MTDEKQRELQEEIAASLHLSGNVVLERDPYVGLGIRPDLYFIDDNKKIVVEISNTATVHKLAQLALYQRVMAKEKNVKYVLAAKVIPTKVREIADQIDIEIVALPHYLTIEHREKIPHGMLTTEKAWRVSSRLLKEKRCSIRRISQAEKISYGWAHRTVKRLISRGIVDQKGQIVELVDANKLLDAIAWERPFNDLFIDEYKTFFTEPYEAARTISSMFNDKAMIQFTAYTSASLYVGYGMRHDSIFCYVSNTDIMDQIRASIEPGDGIIIKFYLPDRLIKRRKKNKDVIITSPSQTLLDLAGLGYSARDLSRRMVEQYADL